VNVVGYCRVSTQEQADSGLGLAAQKHAITAECNRRGWTLQNLYEDAGMSGKSLSGREALSEALRAVSEHRADALVVAKLDRLSRSLFDFAALMEQGRRQGWALVILDLGVDTTTPSGEMMANVMATFAQFERRLIGQRTKDALAVKRAQGVRLGRPPVLDPKVGEYIVDMRRLDLSYAAIARELNEALVPTAHGGKAWHPTTVRRIALAKTKADPKRTITTRSGVS